jgi:hypothetical protein
VGVGVLIGVITTSMVFGRIDSTTMFAIKISTLGVIW